MKRIIIDADPGVDDTFAIFLAAKTQSIKIEGITTVAGNCSLENATKNTFKALDLAQKLDILVYQGESKPFNSNLVDATNVHGSNGMGGIEYDEINKSIEEQNAIDYLIETVNNNPHEITIVAVGPLTNIAKAVSINSTFASNVKQLLIMGGSTDKGNITLDAEFNFYKDPKAAKIVFDAPFKEIIMFGLNVTTKLVLDNMKEFELFSMNTPISKFLYDITRTGALHDRYSGHDGLVINDPITICYLTNPDIVTLKNAQVKIIETGEQRGKSIVEEKEISNCKVAYDVDSEKFYNILFDAIKKSS